MLRLWIVLAVSIMVISLMLMFLTGCSTIKVAGECTYTRKVETHYQCEPGSTIEHTRVAPGVPSE